MRRIARSPLFHAVGVAAIAVGLTWLLGGQAALRRVDPALALPLLLPPLLLLGWLQRGESGAVRWRAVAATLLLLLATQAALAAGLGGSLPWGQLLLVGCGGALAGWLADRLMRSRRALLRAALALLLFLAWFAGSHLLLAALYRVPAVHGPPVTILTSLPLRWSGGNDFAAMIAAGANDDPALERLAAAGPVRLVDSLVDASPPPGGALLLAHPGALAPQELVAIDAFVRGGGRAIILADALSGWPTRHPLGDPRNPPLTSLLTPLLDHWGVTLEAAREGEEGELAVDVDGARLRLFGAGRFDRLPKACMALADRRVARCPIGKGEAWLVGDADLLYAPLWQPVPPWAAHLRRADSMEWLAARLWPAAPRALLRPVWLRD